MAKLAAYRAKRDFKATPEPSGGRRSAKAGKSKKAAPHLAFVVQKHDASRLHYDLRLELDGVMKSWAVAKGPSLNPGEKRLAVHVEDHPVEYNGFEGTIPKGQYGGGTVMIWDRGSWVPNQDPGFGYRKGHLDFRLEGEKLRGAWHLVRMKKRAGEKQDPWLLIKQEDEDARHGGEPDILEEAPRSVASGREMDEIAQAKDGAVWESNRGLAAEARAGRTRTSGSAARDLPSPSRGGRTRPKAEPDGGPGAGTSSRASQSPPTPDGRSAPARPSPRGGGQSAPIQSSKARPDIPPLDLETLTHGGAEAAFPRSIEPCLATAVEAAPSGAGWLHEIKWDGYRLIAFKSKAGVRLATRRGHDWTKRFPGIRDAVAALPVASVVLDGEAIVEDEKGAASFSALQVALSDQHGQVAQDAVLVAFDLLYLEGFDLRSLPLEDRKARLAALIPASNDGHLRLGEHLETDGPTMMRSARELGLEGVVSKRRDRPYRSGRGKDWVKAKSTDRQDFVIVGFVPSAATPRAVGSLALAYHEGGKLVHVGRAGTGFTAALARDVFGKLDPLRRKTSPVAGRLTAEEKRGVAWVEPKLVAEIEFRGWTGDDHLRHAAFKGLREDKDPAEVFRERPQAVTSGARATAAKASPAKPTASAKPGVVRSRHQEGTLMAGIRLTHPERVLWPEDGVTKQDLAGFYESIADWILPHLVDRPLSLVRCPDGLAGTCFFQKHAWAGLADSISRKIVTDEDGGKEEILFLHDLSGLISLVQASCLEIHPWGARADDVDRPDTITMDLDPGSDVAFGAVMDAARELRDRLAAMKLESFVKTTGGKGLHVVVPLAGKSGWTEVKAFAKSLADAMAADDPKSYLAKASKSERKGKIYVDYLRNGRGATAVAAYSTRARPGATVSVPIRWDDLTSLLKPQDDSIKTLPKRLAALKDDPWMDMRDLAQTLPAASGQRSRSRTAKRTRR